MLRYRLRDGSDRPSSLVQTSEVLCEPVVVTAAADTLSLNLGSYISVVDGALSRLD